MHGLKSAILAVFQKLAVCAALQNCPQDLFFSFFYFKRDGGSGWTGWVYAHPDFGRIDGATRQRRHPALLLARSESMKLLSEVAPLLVIQIQIQAVCD